MPIYEYRCEPCEHTFETLVRGDGDVTHCPECRSLDVVKQFSVPAASQSGGRPGPLPVCGPSPAPMGGCGGGGCGSGMCSLD